MKLFIIILTILFSMSQYLLAFVIGKTAGIQEERTKAFIKQEECEEEFRQKELNLKQRIVDLENAFNSYMHQTESANECRECQINYD